MDRYILRNGKNISMFYLDIPVESWLQKYPALRDEEPLCNCEEHNIVPFRTSKSIGIVCRSCNSGTWIRVTDTDNLKLLRLLLGDIRY